MTSWKEAYDFFDERQIEVLGISVDHMYTQNVFEATLGTLPYPLLADWHKTTARDFGVLDPEDEVSSRACFLIHRDGTLAYRNEAFDAENDAHYQEVFEACRKLESRQS
ncbi:redoxin domain-containing protein [Bacillus luteus]|uniref:Redoxin domain-containing protein n=1 Tax=Alkalicoccus luteus TaxID=1237094 RepID=A0A969PV31_9BACI|nr:redoxin domain-containing protein [Alkalicoccus luteus]